MTPPIRLLVSDIDGTLVRRDKTLSEANVAAILRVRAAGIAVSLISARPPSGMGWIAERLGLDGVLAAFNGGTLFRADGAVMAAEHLDPNVAARVLAMFERPGVARWLFADGRWFTDLLGSAHDDSERKASGVEPVVVGDLPAHSARADKIVAVCDDAALLAGVEREAADAFGGRATVVRSQPYYLDVLARRGNKGDGIAALAEAYGVDLAETAVLGDQMNDLPMFARAGLSVAMGQAPVVVREAATHVAASNDEDGVADAITRFLF